MNVLEDVAHFYQDFYTNFICKIVENPTAEAGGPSRSQLRNKLSCNCTNIDYVSNVIYQLHSMRRKNERHD